MQWERYRDIIWYRAYAELKAEAQLNYMGYVWWLLEPLAKHGSLLGAAGLRAGAAAR